jgi:TolB protein
MPIQTSRSCGWAALLALSLLLVSSFAWAQEGEGTTTAPDSATTGQDIGEIQVRISGGGSFIVPLAVPDTYTDETDTDGVADDIADTIRNCIEISGYFEVYGPDRYFFDPAAEGMNPATINFTNWVNIGAQGLIKTSYRVAANRAALDFRLFDVDTGEQIDIGFPEVTVARGDVQREVYRFVNLVIEYYTGSPGIFGTQIVFTAPDANGNKQVFISGMDGGNRTQVTDAPTIHTLPEWGPGGEIMYTSYINDNPDVFIGDELFSSRPNLNYGATLRPGGEEIAISLGMDGDSELYILDLAGNILRRCTDNTAEDLSPSWSPDGSRLAFVSDRSGGPQIFVMNADCSNQRRVTFAGRYNTEPDWSPLGDLIVFTGRDSRNRFDIFTVNPSNSQITRLTQDQGNNESPSWSPDGRYLVFVSTRGGVGNRLYIMTADGLSQHLITPSGSGYENPSWRN